MLSILCRYCNIRLRHSCWRKSISSSLWSMETSLLIPLLLVFKLVSIITEKDIVTIHGLLHLPIWYHLVELLLLILISFWTEWITCMWLILIWLCLVALIFKLWSWMRTSIRKLALIIYLLVILVESWWVTSILKGAVSWIWRGKWRIELLCLPSSIIDHLNTWDLGLVTLMVLHLLWIYCMSWTSSLGSIVHTSISINAWLTPLIAFVSCVCMLSITHLLLEVCISWWEISCALNAMRSFIRVNRPHIPASRLALSHVSWSLIRHVRSTCTWISHLHWKVVSFCVYWLLEGIGTLTTEKVIIVLTLNEFLWERLVRIIVPVNLLDLHDVLLYSLEVFLSKLFVLM